MQKTLDNFLELINNISAKELSLVAGVNLSMAHKYKNGSSLPRLDTAVLFEDTFGIPARSWADLKKCTQQTK